MLHDIAHKLRGYTRHPTMGGSTSIPQALLNEAADEIEKLRRSADKALRIIDANLYHQREKVEDAKAILRDMAGHNY